MKDFSSGLFNPEKGGMSSLQKAGTSSPQKAEASSSEQSRKPSVNRQLFADDIPAPKPDGKENKNPQNLKIDSNGKGIEQSIPKEILEPIEDFAPYLFGKVKNVGEEENFISNRFMSKVKENEKTNILAELHDFELCVIGYVAVQPPAFTKPIYIFGRSGANISSHPVEKFNPHLGRYLSVLKDVPKKRSAAEKKLNRVKKDDLPKDQEKRKIEFEKETQKIAKSLKIIPAEIMGLYDFGPESSSDKINSTKEDIQYLVDLNKEKDMDDVYSDFMKLNANDKKKFFVLLNKKAKDQITLRLLRDAYNEVCAEMQAENQDAHIWYVDDLSNQSKDKIKQGKSENLDLLKKVDDAEGIQTLLFGNLPKSQLERICAEDKITVELLKLRAITDKHIISGAYYSLSSAARAEKVSAEKQLIDAQRYVVDGEIVLAQPKINKFEVADAGKESKVVISHIASCEICYYLGVKGHQAKAYASETIAISISPCRAKKGKAVPSSEQENKLFNSLIAIVATLPEKIGQSLEDNIRFIFSARDLLGVEGELTQERVDLISIFLGQLEMFIRDNSYDLSTEDLALLSTFVIESNHYLRQMQDAVASIPMDDKRPEASRLFSGSSFFSAASSSSAVSSSSSSSAACFFSAASSSSAASLSLFQDDFASGNDKSASNSL